MDLEPVKFASREGMENKNRGMSFVGSTIIYAFLQSVGIVNDHQIDCFCRIDHNLP